MVRADLRRLGLRPERREHDALGRECQLSASAARMKPGAQLCLGIVIVVATGFVVFDLPRAFVTGLFGFYGGGLIGNALGQLMFKGRQ